MVRLRPLLVAVLFALSVVIPAMPAHAATIPLSEVEAAISLGVSAVYSAVRPLDSSYTYYVMPDHPSPTISVEYGGQLYVPGSFLDPGDAVYRSELVSVTSNSVSWRYYFNVDGDDDYDIVIYAQLTNIDQSTDRLYIYVDKAEYIFNILVGTYLPLKYTGVGQGWSTTIDIPSSSQYRFMSARYVARHSTRIAAWLLEEEGYTYTASKMHSFMDSLGFYYDVYAPLFGKSNSYPDDFFDYKYATWLGNGYEAHPRTTDPSDPYINYAYKSRMYIFDAAWLFSLALWGWKEAPLYKLLRAVHLLNKYGFVAQAEAEQLIVEAITEGKWDGYGLKAANIGGIPYPYKGYPVYLNAALLIALIRYYEVTGDRWVAGNDVLYMADRLAGILTRIQWKYQHDTPWGTVRLVLFKGWWPAAYDIGSLIAKPSAWGAIDTITELSDDVAGMLAKTGYDIPPESLRPVPSEWPFAIVNSESTILAVKALKEYLELAQQLGREPIDPSTSTLLGPEGEYVESGGGGSGTISLSSYWSAYGYTSDGRVLEAKAFSDISTDAWAYAYSKFKLQARTSATYNVTVTVMLRYSGFDALGNHGEVWIVIKLIDSSGNVIAQWEDQAAYLENDSSISGARALSYTLNAGYLPAGTYYVEVGLKVVANTSTFQVAGCLVEGLAFIDTVVLEPA
jgi:hypothetical protein